MLRYYNWLQERIANNVSMDVMVQELLGANGGTFPHRRQHTRSMKLDVLHAVHVHSGLRVVCLPSSGLRRCFSNDLNSL